MPKYLIERNIPGAGNSTKELTGISEKSCSVLNTMGRPFCHSRMLLAGIQSKISRFWIPDKSIRE